MTVQEWSKSELEYGRKVLDSGLEGVRSGREAFLNDESFTLSVRNSMSSAWKPALVGACAGLLGSCSRNGRKSMGRTLLFGLLGGVFGLGAGIAWHNRRLTSSVVGEALRRIGRVRDEHWLERHPIDYA